MRHFTTDEINSPGSFVLLDLPLRYDFTEDEFDRLADLKIGEKFITAEGFTLTRVS